MIDERAEALTRRSFHCATAGVVTAIIAVTVWGLSAPWSVVFVAPIGPEFAAVDPTLGAMHVDVDVASAATAALLAFGGLIVGWFAWALLVQHRRPWPVGRRLPAERVRWRLALAVAPALFVQLLPRLLVDPLRAATGLTLPVIPGYRVVVSAPVDLAIGMVLWLALGAIGAMIAYVVAAAMLRSWDPDKPAVRMAPAEDAKEAVGWSA